MQLRSIKIKSVSEDAYPFNLPVVKSTKEIELNKPITILVGENGSGKSSLLEALAIATKLPTIGEHNSAKDPSLNYARELANSIKLTWSINNHRGFFMRAEDFFGFQKDIATHSPILMALPDAEILEVDGNGILKKTGYDELDHVSTMRDFLSNPDIFIKRL